MESDIISMMDETAFDISDYRKRRVQAARGVFSGSDAILADLSPAEQMEWQTTFRARFAEILGGLDCWERPPLEATVEETVQCEGHRRETVTFTTRPGLRAFGYFLVPDNCLPGQPTVLCLPGHGNGVDGMVDIAPDGYSSSFAIQCVQQGYPTFALEQISFGHRRDEAARAQGPNASSCHRDSMAALMLGETISGWRVWDAMRALDYLETRTDFVDPARMSVMGISGGGLTALFTAALDTRVFAAVVSGYFNTWADSVLSIQHCVDNYVPGLMNLCEMPDLAALIAPRALFVENGQTDPIFPVTAFEKAVAQAERTYAALGASDRFSAEIFDGGHRFHGVGAFASLTGLWAR